MRMQNKSRKAKQFDTEASPVVPHQSTNSAQSCLTSVCRWERVYSRCYDRTMHVMCARADIDCFHRRSSAHFVAFRKASSTTTAELFDAACVP